MFRVNTRQLASIALACVFAALASAVLTIVLMGVNVLSTGVDRAPIRAHVAQAFANGDLDDAWHLRTNTQRGAHQFNDCLILLMIIDERLPATQRALSPLKAGVDVGDAGPCVRLREFIGGHAAPIDATSPYHRYLHGHVALDAPMLASLSLRNVRTLFDAVMFASLAGLLALCGWRIHAGLAAAGQRGASSVSRALFGGLAALTLLLFWGLQFYGMSLSHFPSDIILIGYIYLLVLTDLQRWPAWAGALLHGGFGALTAYLEFLTGGIPLGFCLIFFAYAAGAVAGAPDAPILRGLGAAAAFATGVAIAFVVKMALTVAVFGPAVIHDFFQELSYRVGGANVHPWDMPVGLISASQYLGAGWRLLGIALLAAPVVLFIVDAMRIVARARSAPPSPPSPRVVLLCLSAVSIWGWWLVFAQHSLQHNFFMVRIGVGAVFSVAALSCCVYAAELRSLAQHLLKMFGPDPKNTGELNAGVRFAPSANLAARRAEDAPAE